MSDIDWEALDKSPAMLAAIIKQRAPQTYEAIRREQAREGWTQHTERRARRRAELEAQGVVYYVETRPGVVKIGYTGKLRQRLADLRVSHEDLLAIEPGGRDVERERHEWFAHARLHPKREDFALAQEIQGHIAAMRALHPLPRWATLPDTTKVTRR